MLHLWCCASDFILLKKYIRNKNILSVKHENLKTNLSDKLKAFSLVWWTSGAILLTFTSILLLSRVVGGYANTLRNGVRCLFTWSNNPRDETERGRLCLDRSHLAVCAAGWETETSTEILFTSFLSRSNYTNQLTASHSDQGDLGQRSHPWQPLLRPHSAPLVASTVLGVFWSRKPHLHVVFSARNLKQAWLPALFNTVIQLHLQVLFD